MFGESSSSDESDDDDDCKMCRHQKKGNYQKPAPDGADEGGAEEGGAEGGTSA